MALSQPWVVSLHTRADWYSAEYLDRTICLSWEFFEQHCLLQYSTLQTLAALISPDSQLGLLNWRSPLDFTFFIWPGPSLKAVNWDEYRSYLIGFSSLRDHCLFLNLIPVSCKLSFLRDRVTMAPVTLPWLNVELTDPILFSFYIIRAYYTVPEDKGNNICSHLLSTCY